MQRMYGASASRRPGNSNIKRVHVYTEHGRSLTHSHVGPPTQSLIPSLFHFLALSFPHSLNYSLSHWLSFHSLPSSPFQILTQLLTHTVTPSLPHSLPQFHSQPFTLVYSILSSTTVTQSLPFSLFPSVSHSVTDSLFHSLPLCVTPPFPHSITQSVSLSVSQSFSQPLVVICLY